MDGIMLDRAYAALQSTMGDVKGWEQIQPARKLIPASIVRKEAQLTEALARLDQAAEINEQARTDVTVEALREATESVNVICKELEFLRELFLNNPAYFEEE